NDSANPDNGPPEADTRRLAYDGVFASIFDVRAIGNAAASGMFKITAMTTQASNFLISLAYSPIMKSFGLDTIIVNMIESFRDSLFFPLSALAAMFGGLVLLFRM